MATLGEKVAERDRAMFVGRARELAWFDNLIGAPSAIRVVHLFGPGGIGKSSLLREVARRAEQLGYHVSWLEGRTLPPFPEALETELAQATATDKPLLIFDSFELISSLERDLRDRIVPSLPEDALVILSSRSRPSPLWFEGGWDSTVHVLDLAELSSDESKQLLQRHGVDSADVDPGVLRKAGGSPLALAAAASATVSGGDGSMAALAGRLLGDEASDDRYRALCVAALARVTTPELLEAVLPDQDPHDHYKWLAERSFCEPLADGLALHALVATAVRDALRERDPSGEASLRRRIADALYYRAIAGHFSLSFDLQHLVTDPTVRWGYSLDIGSRYRVDTVTAADIAHIGGVLGAIGMDAWWGITEIFFRNHPECCGVARDSGGGVGGYYVAVSAHDPPAAALDDVLLGPWLRHARDVLHTTSAVLAREAVDLTGELGEITALLGSGSIIGSGVINPRYIYLPIAPELPAARAFSVALGGRHLSELDVSVHGMALECHLIDFGSHGILGFQRDWVYRETGVTPPSMSTDLDVAKLIRALRDPSMLSNGPAWLGTTPSERLARLRDLVTEALDTFGPSRDDAVARQLMQAAYLGAGEAHETIARHMHLSRSAYFRRLHAAAKRVADEVESRWRAR